MKQIKFKAIALMPLKKRIDSYSYNWSDAYLLRDVKTNEAFWVYAANCYVNACQGEIVEYTRNRHPHTANPTIRRATGVMTLPRLKKTKREHLVAQFFNKKRFKRERNIYKWYEDELSNIQREVDKVYSDMDKSFCEISLPEKKRFKYEIKLKEKTIKTKYGIKNGAYQKNIKINYSPYNDFKVYKNYESLTLFKNKEEFKCAKFPLYLYEGEKMLYLLERKDFDLVENCNEKLEIDYVNKWEDAIIELEKKRVACRRWFNRCLEKIKKDISEKYNIPAPKY